MKLLYSCGALAAGEYLASLVPRIADIWPLPAVGVVLTALFGYGLSWRGWHVVAFFLLGAALFLLASVPVEQMYREQPWLRGREARSRHLTAEPVGVLKSVKADFSRRVGIGLENEWETVALNRAILLGERRRLPRKMRRLFIESGTMHVFAISGLHVMAVAEVLAYVLAMLFVPRRVAGVVAVPPLWAYVWMIGLTPSAVRAALMATFVCIAPLVWRKPDGLRAWALTFLLVHLVRPRLIVDVGNVLSFAVMLSIVLAGDWSRVWAGWKRTLFVTCVAWAVGVPISAHVFGRVTPGGMLANLVLIAVARLTVYAGAIGLVSSYLSDAVAAHLNNLGALAVRAMVFTADAVARLPWANVETGRWSLLPCVGWYVALGLGAFLLYKGEERRQMV